MLEVIYVTRHGVSAYFLQGSVAVVAVICSGLCQKLTLVLSVSSIRLHDSASANQGMTAVVRDCGRSPYFPIRRVWVEAIAVTKLTQLVSVQLAR